ncbi:MAG: hypothetical protein QOG04_569 [Actinomycetota bacterium]|jgi:hypothetical protein|nr:hypothetical protein [Actinomycetota bacterium]
MHVGEDGVVSGAETEPVSGGRIERSRIDPLNRSYEVRIVRRSDLILGRNPSVDLRNVSELGEAQRADVVVGEQNALGAERVAGAEVVEASEVSDRNQRDRLVRGYGRSS